VTEQTRIRILLNPAWHGRSVPGTVAEIRWRFCERGLTGCVERKSPDLEYDRKLDGEQEAEKIPSTGSTTRPRLFV